MDQRARVRTRPVGAPDDIELGPTVVQLGPQGGGLHRHDCRHHRLTLGNRHLPVARCPAVGLALDALPVGGVPAGIADPVRPAGCEVEPHHLGAHLGLGRHLQRDPPPVRQHRVIERRGMARDHHQTGQPLEQVKQSTMVSRSVVMAVTPVRAPSPLQIGGIAVDQLRAAEREGSQEGVGTTVHPLHRVATRKPLERTPIPVNADRTQSRGLALHQRTAPKMRFDIHIVRRKQSQKHLAQPTRGLGSEITHRRSPSLSTPPRDRSGYAVNHPLPAPHRNRKPAPRNNPTSRWNQGG